MPKKPAPAPEPAPADILAQNIARTVMKFVGEYKVPIPDALMAIHMTTHVLWELQAREDIKTLTREEVNREWEEWMESQEEDEDD